MTCDISPVAMFLETDHGGRVPRGDFCLGRTFSRPNFMTLMFLLMLLLQVQLRAVQRPFFARYESLQEK